MDSLKEKVARFKSHGGDLMSLYDIVVDIVELMEKSKKGKANVKTPAPAKPAVKDPAVS